MAFSAKKFDDLLAEPWEESADEPILIKGDALDTCPAASSIRHDNSTFDPKSKSPECSAVARKLDKTDWAC